MVRHIIVLESIASALAEDRRLKERDEELVSLRKGFDELTNRERQVIQLVTSGFLNKQVAAELDLSEITVKLHRGRAMRKMGARTLAQVVRMMKRSNAARDSLSRARHRHVAIRQGSLSA